MLFIIKSEEGRVTSNQSNIGIEYSESNIRLTNAFIGILTTELVSKITHFDHLEVNGKNANIHCFNESP
jgi:hypothetical protein